VRNIYLQHDGYSGHSGVPLRGQSSTSAEVDAPEKAKALDTIASTANIAKSLRFIFFISSHWVLFYNIRHVL
jgi:hypothetical protein